MREWFKKIRVSKKMTQAEVAILAGCSRSLVTDIENGKATPSIKTAKTLAKIFEFDWTIFFQEDQKAG